MKHILPFILLLLTSVVFADDRQDFLKAWESVQKNSSEVRDFSSIKDNYYHIKFKNLPFEGELHVLAYEVEDMPSPMDSLTYSKMGYVEYELVGAPADMRSKYARTFQKWAKNNTLYFDEKLSKWDSYEEFSQQLMNGNGMDKVALYPSLLTFFDYWDYLLIVILIYFFFSQIVNSKRAKDSVAMQKKALEDMERNKVWMQQSIEMQKQNNQLLADILEAMKK